MKATLRKRMIAAAATVAIMMAWIGLNSATAVASPTTLLVPAATASRILGCSGSLTEKNYGSAFDATTGYPDGFSYLSMTCGCGRFCSHTYTAWVSTTWDFTGVLVSYTTLQSTPTVNPTLSVYDSHGNHLYNQTNSAYLALAAGFVPPPRVAGVSPASDPQGSTVTITGTSFTGATAVSFGSNAASFTVNSSTSITATAPAVQTGTVDVTVTNSGGTSLVNSSDQFTFTLTPRVGGLSPNQGSSDGGTSVTVTGVNFTGATGVSFGGVPASFSISSDTTIIAVSPAVGDPVVVDVTVTSSYGTSALTASDRFTYN